MVVSRSGGSYFPLHIGANLGGRRCTGLWGASGRLEIDSKGMERLSNALWGRLGVESRPGGRTGRSEAVRGWDEKPGVWAVKILHKPRVVCENVFKTCAWEGENEFFQGQKRGCKYAKHWGKTPISRFQNI